ncbi:MAG: transposase [Rhodocyclaceae bacterium]|nr:transposase [Rhodocyclaceae bacterium]
MRHGQGREDCRPGEIREDLAVASLGICAYAAHPITTARLEAGNVAIGLLRRRARGFRDTGYLKLKIYQLNTPDQPSFLYANVPPPDSAARMSTV